jgi:hypothetical protein
MIRRQIEFDEETDRILAELARDHEGDLGRALAELVHTHQSLEAFLEKCEEGHRESLRAQVERSEKDFREKRFTTWGEVKRRNRL